MGNTSLIISPEVRGQPGLGGPGGGGAAGRDQQQADAVPTQLLSASSSHPLAQEKASNTIDSKNPTNPLGGDPNKKQISCA